MKQHRLYALGALALSLVVPRPAQAQTVANGPYYASPSWDMTLPAAQRFIVLANMNGDAVLDRETGLVWERSPVALGNGTITFTWMNARTQCAFRLTGGRKGWRLPTIHELNSLVDTSVAFHDLALSPGHPFLNVQPASARYWSATRDSRSPDWVWLAQFNAAPGLALALSTASAQVYHVWCVRGAMTTDMY